MLKASLAAAIVAIVAACPAYAAQDLCNDAHMKQMDQMIAEMTRRRQAEGGDGGSRSIKGGHEEGRYGGLHEVYERGPYGHGPVTRAPYFVIELGAACETIGQSSVFSSACTSSSSLLVLI
jgi:hypothetical protein